MPIYEYICEACEESYDALQKMSDELLTDCPSCGKPQLKKKLSAPNFRLSGSGWYETDFKSGNKRNISDNGSKPESSSSTPESSGSTPESKSSKSESSSSKPAPSSAVSSSTAG